jgi:hypothetical protein
MKPALIIVAAAGLCGGLPASAHTSGGVAVAPSVGSTGPTVPDTRQVDQSTIQPPSSSAAPINANPTNTYGNWRTSDGLNADPNNPSGAPGNSSVGTSPSR